MREYNQRRSIHLLLKGSGGLQIIRAWISMAGGSCLDFLFTINYATTFKQSLCADLVLLIFWYIFMFALYNLLDGSSDNTKFENNCQALIDTTNIYNVYMTLN